MNNLKEATKTVNDNGVNSIPETEVKPTLTVIIGAYNEIHAQNVVQLNADKLPETIESVAQELRDLSPESVDKIASSLERLMNAIAELVAKNNK